MKAIFIILKPYNFPLRVFCKSDLRISMVGKHEGIIIIKIFNLEILGYLAHYYDLIRFQRYRCESGIVIFVWRVT